MGAVATRRGRRRGDRVRAYSLAAKGQGSPAATRRGRRWALSAGAGKDAPVVVAERSCKSRWFQPRADLLVALDAPGPRSRVVVVHARGG